MKSIEHRAIMIMVFVMVAFNTVFLSANGLFMLVAPEPWYNLVPGVTDTGFLTNPAGQVPPSHAIVVIGTPFLSVIDTTP